MWWNTHIINGGDYSAGWDKFTKPFLTIQNGWLAWSTWHFICWSHWSIVAFMCALSATCLFQCYAHVVCIFAYCTLYEHLQAQHFLMRCCVELGGCLFKCYRYEYSCTLGRATLHPLSFFDSKKYKRLTFSEHSHFYTLSNKGTPELEVKITWCNIITYY